MGEGIWIGTFVNELDDVVMNYRDLIYRPEQTLPFRDDSIDEVCIHLPRYTKNLYDQLVREAKRISRGEILVTAWDYPIYHITR